MPDLWSKLDDFIYEARWHIALILLAVSLIGGGAFMLTHPESLAGSRLASGGSTATFDTPAATVPVEKAGPVNINTADQIELESLPGIGPAIAQRILDYRKSHGPFKKKEDLMDVKGIGPKTFASLKDKITLQ